MELECNLKVLPMRENFCMVDRLDSFTLHLLRPGAVGYLCAKEDAERIVARVSRLAQCLEGTEEQAINGILLLLGLPPQCVGYPYTAEAIMVIRQNQEQSITKELYRTLAKQHSTDTRQIERAIRIAISSGWERGDRMVWAMLFPPRPDGSAQRPTNGQFLFRLARLFDLWELPK